jgi:hypothetical protein
MGEAELAQRRVTILFFEKTALSRFLFCLAFSLKMQSNWRNCAPFYLRSLEIYAQTQDVFRKIVVRVLKAPRSNVEDQILTDRRC